MLVAFLRVLPQPNIQFSSWKNAYFKQPKVNRSFWFVNILISFIFFSYAFLSFEGLFGIVGGSFEVDIVKFDNMKHTAVLRVHKRFSEILQWISTHLMKIFFFFWSSSEVQLRGAIFFIKSYQLHIESSSSSSTILVLLFIYTDFLDNCTALDLKDAAVESAQSQLHS